MTCRTTHHLACGCREAEFAAKDKRIAELERELAEARAAKTSNEAFGRLAANALAARASAESPKYEPMPRVEGAKPVDVNELQRRIADLEAKAFRVARVAGQERERCNKLEFENRALRNVGDMQVEIIDTLKAAELRARTERDALAELVSEVLNDGQVGIRSESWYARARAAIGEGK